MYALGMPPLNQTLWMLLVVSLIVVVCLGALYLLGAAQDSESKVEEAI